MTYCRNMFCLNIYFTLNQEIEVAKRYFPPDCYL